MLYKLLIKPTVIVAACLTMSGCAFLRDNAKYNFNDGIYRTNVFSHDRVYVMHVDEDTVSVFPVKEYGDSTAIQTQKRVNYTTMQRRLKDNKASHAFYKPSFDADLMTIPLKYRPAEKNIPNQLVTNYNGALFLGYRVDEYRLRYKRTPLNSYKQDVKHIGYSAGLYCGIGSSLVNPWVLTDPKADIEYDGLTLISGIAANMAADKITFGIAVGVDHLLDKNHKYWIYQGKPNIGFTVGLDLY